MFATVNKEHYLARYSKNWVWFLSWGILLMVVGLAAIGVSTLTTLLSVLFLGVVLMVGGVVVIVDTFKFWWGHWNGFILHLAIAIFYLIIGGMLVKNPVISSIALTFVIGVLYLILGIFRLIYSLAFQLPQWGWGLVNSIISLLIGILILYSWPTSGLFVIGLFIGIDLFVAGWVYLMIALAGRNFAA